MLKITDSRGHINSKKYFYSLPMTVNYRDTLNLPDTDFSMKAGLPRKEPEILEMWSSSDLYGKIRKKI